MTALKVRLIIMRALVTLLRPTLTREDQQQGGVGGKLPFAPNPSILLLSNYLRYISENFQRFKMDILIMSSLSWLLSFTSLFWDISGKVERNQFLLQNCIF